MAKFGVFDWSTQNRETLANENLLFGSDLTNQLVGLLITVRVEPVACMADIQAIFYQVKVQKSRDHS